MSTKERKALGRGFGALLRSVEEPSESKSSNELPQIDIDEIGFNPRQPRQTIDNVKLEELAQSIKTKGVIQPILVRPTENSAKKYELIAGERRLRASRLAGFDKIPAIVKSIKDNELLEIALIENIQRDDLNPIEESRAYRDLLEEHGYTQENLAQRVGKNRSTIANFIRLLQLPDVVQEDLIEARLSTGHARSLLAVEDKEKQLEVRDRILKEKLSVRETEDAIRGLKKKEVSKPVKEKTASSPQMVINQDRLRDRFGTKVSIKSRGKKGCIEFEYYSEEDFNRIFSLLLN